MLEIYKTNAESRKLEVVDEITKGCWVNLSSPNEQEIQRVAKEANVPVDFIRDALDDEERSRIEKEEGDVFIIIDYPYMVKDESGYSVYETLPLGMILTEDCFITISLKEAPVLSNFKNNKMKEFYTYKKTRFALQVLFVISSYYLRYLKQINKKTDDVERELHHSSMTNKELYSLLALEKSLVYFTTSLKSNKMVLDKILRIKYLKLYEEDEDLLEDVMIENTQAIEMAATYSSILTSMMNAFSSIISNNLNVVMKFLTSITIILAFPTMVASFLGMNVPLPFGLENYPHGFLSAILVSIFLAATIAFIFWKKKYF